MYVNCEFRLLTADPASRNFKRQTRNKNIFASAASLLTSDKCGRLEWESERFITSVPFTLKGQCCIFRPPLPLYAPPPSQTNVTF